MERYEKNQAFSSRYFGWKPSEPILLSIFSSRNLFRRFDIMMSGRVVSARDLTSTDLSFVPIATVSDGTPRMHGKVWVVSGRHYMEWNGWSSQNFRVVYLLPP